MFDGKAEEAMDYYTSLFEKSEIVSISRYGPNENGIEGAVRSATFSLKGQEFMCIDSAVKFVTCDTQDEVDRLYEKLSQGGRVFMPLAVYPFSKKFCWVVDRFGVSWQLSLEN